MKTIRLKVSIILILITTIVTLTTVVPILAISTQFAMRASKTTVQRGEKVTITVGTKNVADLNGGFNSYNGSLSSDPAYVTFNKEKSLVPNWVLNYQGARNTFVGYDTTNTDFKVADLDLVSFEFTVLDQAPLGETTIDLSELTIADKRFNDHKLPNESITLTIEAKKIPDKPIKSSNSKLNDIKIKAENGKEISLSPKFSTTTTTYTASVAKDQNQIDISAIVADSKATIIAGGGKHNLVDGNNKIDLVIRAEDGSETKYTINVNKPTADSGGNDTGGNDTGGNDTNGSNTGGSANGSGSFDVNINNNNTNTNTNTNKNDNQTANSSNNYIVEILGLGNLNKEFNKHDTKYHTVVGKETEHLNLSVLLDDPNSTYQIKGDKDLEIGSNQVVIEVVAPNGDVREYIIDVERTKEESGALLSAMSIGGYALNPGFVESQMFYSMIVPSEVTTLGVSTTAKYGGADVNVDGNQTIKPGLNYVKIAVSANGQRNTYVVEVVRQQPEPVFDYLPWVIAGFGIFTTIILLIILLLQGRKTVVYNPPYPQNNE